MTIYRFKRISSSIIEISGENADDARRKACDAPNHLWEEDEEDDYEIDDGTVISQEDNYV